MKGRVIVTIESSNGVCYLTDGEGDPARTTKKECAKRFNSIDEAEQAIAKAKQTHPFKERVYGLIVTSKLGYDNNR